MTGVGQGELVLPRSSIFGNSKDHFGSYRPFERKVTVSSVRNLFGFYDLVTSLNLQNLHLIFRRKKC
jgi:hypothetical protein